MLTARDSARFPTPAATPIRPHYHPMAAISPSSPGATPATRRSTSSPSMAPLPPQRVTRNGAEEWGPAFSPDGRRIAFHSNREGQFELYEADLNGENLVRLTNSPPGNDADASYSPDGRPHRLRLRARRWRRISHEPRWLRPAAGRGARLGCDRSRLLAGRHAHRLPIEA